MYHLTFTRDSDSGKKTVNMLIFISGKIRLISHPNARIGRKNEGHNYILRYNYINNNTIKSS